MPNKITCNKCGIEKDLSLFPKRTGTPLGVRKTCKSCSKPKRIKTYNIPERKICNKCGIEKPAKAFAKNAGKKCGLVSHCKECKSKHYYKTKAKPLEQMKQKGVRLNTETHKWCSSCSQLLLREGNFYNHKSSSDGLTYRCKACHSRAEVERRNKDPNYKLRTNVSRAIRGMLAGKQKSGSCLSYLPYSFQQLREHLESQFDDQMSWENYGSYWDVDHIYPHSLLPYDSMEHPNFAKCWALENLQPLEKIENIKKSNKVFDEPLT